MFKSRDPHALVVAKLLSHLRGYANGHWGVVDQVIPKARIVTSATTDRVVDVGVYLTSRKLSPRLVDLVPQVAFDVIGLREWAWLAGDSLDAVELVMELEEELGEAIPEHEADEIESAADVVHLVERREIELRRHEFARVELQEYVVFDRHDGQASIHRLTQRGYDFARLGPREPYTTPQLPGLEIPVHEILDPTT